MGRIEDLAERDGWLCWLCEAPIDPDAPADSAGAPTVDHVVPRSRGGATEAANLRLAHRRCNGERGNALPELDWPARFDLIDSTPLWQAVVRILKRRAPEIIAVAPTAERAQHAALWASTRVTRFVGGSWTTELEAVGAGGDAHVVRLRLDGDPDITDAGRPVGDRGRRR